MVSATVSLGLSHLNPISCWDKPSLSFMSISLRPFCVLSLGVPKMTVFYEGTFWQHHFSVANVQPSTWGPAWSGSPSFGAVLQAAGQLAPGCPLTGVCLHSFGSPGRDFDMSVVST